jgi:hypothetical protein
MLGSEMDSEDLIHLLTEVIIGVDPAKSCLPDTAEVREQRAQIAESVAATRAQGLVPDVPHEFPDAYAVAPVTS